METEERRRQAIEYLGKAARLLVRQQQYEEALTIIAREIDAHLSVTTRYAQRYDRNERNK